MHIILWIGISGKPVILFSTNKCSMGHYCNAIVNWSFRLYNIIRAVVFMY